MSDLKKSILAKLVKTSAPRISPTTKALLLGGGLGAAIGGASGYHRSYFDPKEQRYRRASEIPRKTRLLRSALAAATGAALGAPAAASLYEINKEFGPISPIRNRIHRAILAGGGLGAAIGGAAGYHLPELYFTPAGEMIETPASELPRDRRISNAIASAAIAGYGGGNLGRLLYEKRRGTKGL